MAAFCILTSFSLQHAINSGIIKLAALTPVINVYRGMSGLALPPQLEGTNKFGSRLAIEYGEFQLLVPCRTRCCSLRWNSD